MAKRIRDYRAEERRRNELARLRGETNRYQQRRKIETGILPPIQPKRVTSPKTRAAQARMLATAPRRKSQEFQAPGVIIPHIPDTDRAQDWSDLFARSGVAKYEPTEARSLGVTRKEYTTAYLKAFVTGDARYDRVRHNKTGASSHLFYWLVTLHGYLSIDEYESRYGPAL